MYHYLQVYNLWYCTLCRFTKDIFILYCDYITRYNIIVSWRSLQAFTNDPLHIQIGREYFIKLVKYKFQGGWFIQFKIQYQLRIKGPKTKCIKTLGLLLVLAPHCGTLFLHLSGVS